MRNTYLYILTTLYHKVLKYTSHQTPMPCLAHSFMFFFIFRIPTLFQCPFIWISTTEFHGLVLRVVDEVPNPAYSTDLFSTNTPPFTFWERAVELATACWRHFVVKYVYSIFETMLFVLFSIHVCTYYVWLSLTMSRDFMGR